MSGELFSLKIEACLFISLRLISCWLKPIRAMCNVLTSNNERPSVHRTSSIMFSFLNFSRSMWATMMGKCNAAVSQLFFLAKVTRDSRKELSLEYISQAVFVEQTFFLLLLEVHFRKDHCYNFSKFSCRTVSSVDFLFRLTQYICQRNLEQQTHWERKEKEEKYV